MKQAFKFWTALGLLILMGAWVAGVALMGIWNAVVWLVGLP